MDLADLLVFAAKGILPAAAAALLLVGIGGTRLLPLAVALGVVLAPLLLKGEAPQWPWQLWPAGDGVHWLVWVVVASALAALLFGQRGVPRALPAALGSLAVAAMPWLVSSRLCTNGTWTAADAALHVGAGTATAIALWQLFLQTAERRPGLLVGVTWTACLCVDAIALLRSGSAYLAQIAGAVAAAAGAAMCTAIWRRPFVLGPGAALAVAAAHGGILFAGVALAELPPLPALAAAFAPCGIWLGTGPGATTRRGTGLLPGIAVTVLLAVAALWGTWGTAGWGF